jgi:type IV pilus assembly protein PilV
LQLIGRDDAATLGIEAVASHRGRTMTTRPHAHRSRHAGRCPAVARKRPRGSALVETLIAILIFASGIVGIVALQSQSIRHVGDAQYRAEAMFVTDALIAQMWASDARTLATDFDSGGPGAGYAAFRRFVQRLPGGLPGASIAGNEPVVAITPGPTAGSSHVAVTVYWRLPGDPTRHNYRATAVIGRN